ncbi:MAG: HEPN domain-containing protein [Sedimentisphaerales bacterium]|nr:HEPN domain-containing protein [Sedimentisphaerales bacterium]
MMQKYGQEIAANLERAQHSIEAAKEMAASGFYDFVASRAYYTAFYAATAALLDEGVELSKHSGVIASVHQRLVKTGKIDKQQGKDLNWLFELRNVGDYGITLHVSQQDAERSIRVAEDFLHVIKSLLRQA